MEDNDPPPQNQDEQHCHTFMVRQKSGFCGSKKSISMMLELKGQPPAQLGKTKNSGDFPMEAKLKPREVKEKPLFYQNPADKLNCLEGESAPLSPL
ncbi:hypothetical protein TNIN_248091 [Trichonephila inaurata madagascariensis]|uniref:Uncharacterized protein n=1 Tax=Trichonephila inaurata madagascariensis TaxID=2747483 RepID=A0A8X6MKV4_9ARAC|nr:hypothetical protein TNIN_248091 [Trichonephila inaurata madagascariensis]